MPDPRIGQRVKKAAIFLRGTHFFAAIDDEWGEASLDEELEGGVSRVAWVT